MKWYISTFYFVYILYQIYEIYLIIKKKKLFILLIAPQQCSIKCMCKLSVFDTARVRYLFSRGEVLNWGVPTLLLTPEPHCMTHSMKSPLFANHVVASSLMSCRSSGLALYMITSCVSPLICSWKKQRRVLAFGGAIIISQVFLYWKPALD